MSTRDESALTRSRSPRNLSLGSLHAKGVAIGVLAVSFGVGLSACGGGSPPPAPKASQSTVTANLNKAIVQLNKGNDAVAAAEFLVVVKEDPANQIAWYDLGYIAEEHGQNSQAIHDYQASIGADATYVPALYNLAILDTPKKPNTAIKLYQEAIAVDPTDADAHLNLGFLFVKVGQVTAGKEELARAIQLNPALNSRVPTSDTASG